MLMSNTDSPTGYLGLPMFDPTPDSPASTATDPNANKSSSWIDDVENSVGNFFHDASTSVGTGFSKVGGAIADTYHGAVHGIESAYGGLKDEASGLVDFGLSRVLLILVVVAGGLYFIGKSGVVGQASKF